MVGLKSISRWVTTAILAIVFAVACPNFAEGQQQQPHQTVPRPRPPPILLSNHLSRSSDTLRRRCKDIILANGYVSTKTYRRPSNDARWKTIRSFASFRPSSSNDMSNDWRTSAGVLRNNSSRF